MLQKIQSGHYFRTNIMQKNEIQNKIDFILTQTKNQQMTKEEYEYIASFLKNKNFLIFGTGYDSDLWRECNRQGFCVFLEHDSKWIDETKSDIFQVHYSCSMSQSDRLLDEYEKKNFTNFNFEYPKWLHNYKWDSILVDGPPGNKKTAIGRMQSMFLAKKLASENTNIFIHDVDRKVEQEFSSLFFSKSIKKLTKLEHKKI